MGVIGEPIIGSTNRLNIHNKLPKRKETKVTSLDGRLPKIGDSMTHDYSDPTNPSTSRNLKLPSLNSQNKNIMDIYGHKNKLRQNMKYRMQPNYRYKHVSLHTKLPM